MNSYLGHMHQRHGSRTWPEDHGYGEEKDPEKRRILQELLAKEQMKLQS
jgi:hypothetical protein